VVKATFRKLDLNQSPSPPPVENSQHFHMRQNAAPGSDMADRPQTFDGLEAPRTVSLEELVTNHIEQVLAAHAGNISAAARALRLDRRTLQRRLRKLASARAPAQ